LQPFDAQPFTFYSEHSLVERLADKNRSNNFKRDHIEKYGLPYSNAPEFLEAHKEQADRMLQEKLKEMGPE
jgi:hypothetical protein